MAKLSFRSYSGVAALLHVFLTHKNKYMENILVTLQDRGSVMGVLHLIRLYTEDALGTFPWIVDSVDASRTSEKYVPAGIIRTFCPNL